MFVLEHVSIRRGFLGVTREIWRLGKEWQQEVLSHCQAGWHCLYFRSSENDDATKRKVNLVFEKIQTLKSRAAGNTQVKDTGTIMLCLCAKKSLLYPDPLLRKSRVVRMPPTTQRCTWSFVWAEWAGRFSMHKSHRVENSTRCRPTDAWEICNASPGSSWNADGWD